MLSRSYRLVLLLMLAVSLASCARADQAAAPTSAPAAPAAPTSAPAPTPAETASPAPANSEPNTQNSELPPGTFQNPVFRRDFPDPGVVDYQGTFYAFATNGSGQNVQAARSQDLVRWEAMPDAMPALPAWVRLGQPDVWAPEAIEAGGQYVLFFTARDKASGKQCIGVATAPSPAERFRSAADAPLVCQTAEGGSIDPSPFRDGDQLFLYWKNDGNCCGQPTYLYVQPLAPDGLSLAGEPTRLVRNDAPWEGSVVEAPTMVRHDEDYFLFFSGNSYGGLEYAVGYALCESPRGPCQDAETNPILASKADAPPLVVGPGHQEVVEAGGETWMLYHAWEVLSNGTRGNRRFMWLDRLEWPGGQPDVIGPTVDPQPAPAIAS